MTLSEKHRQERTILKLTLTVREIERRLSYKLNSLLNRTVTGSNPSEADYSSVSPLRLIFPNYAENPYLKVLVSNISTILPQTNMEQWAAKCENSGVFNIHHKRMELAATFFQYHSFKRNHFNAFIFWGMVGVVINKEHFDDNLSFTIDLARAFGLTPEEIIEMSEVVKAFFGEGNRDYVFKERTVENLFSGVHAYLTGA